MTGRRSGKHSENAHPDDCANLEAVRVKIDELLKIRLASGVSVSFISQSLGHRHEFMGQVRQPFSSDTHGWLFDSFHDLCLGVMAVPRLKLYGLDGFTSPMWEVARGNPRYLGIGAQEILKLFRRSKGISNEAAAETMGVVKSAIYRIENSDNPYMGSIQKYARAIGLIAKFDAIQWRNGDPGEWK